jgi:two-component system response regulator FixJ
MATIEMAVSAIHDGALTFIERPFPVSKLVEALSAADAKLAALQVSTHTASSSLTQLNRLSRRERVVLEGIANGQQNKHMAHQLGLSVRTIEMYRRNLFKKLGVNSVAAATKLYLEVTK